MMNKDWKQMAIAQQLPVSDVELARLASALQGLETAFRPLVSAIPWETEPATIPSSFALEGDSQLP